MAQYDYDIGIIGAGAGGLTVAAGAAQLGAKTLLVEKENELGGDCLHFGCVPSKTLIKSAHVYHLMKNAERFGLPKIEVPPVEFKNVSERVRSVINDIQHHDSVERFCGLGAQVEFGHPKFSDEHAIRLNGKNHTVRSWVIASGSSAIIPPINGYGISNYTASQHFYMLGAAARFVRHPKYDFGMHLDVGAVYGIFDKGYPSNVQPIDLGIYNTQPAPAMAIGAFYDYNIKPKWAVRIYTDWQPTFYGKTYQDEFAGAFGIVYKFGARKIK